MKTALALMILSLPIFGAQQTWKGQISDSMCGSDHAAMGDMAKSPKDCTSACVKGGGKYVFVADGKVFDIANQTFGDLAKASGQSVSLTGDLAGNGKAITVTKIAVAK